MVVCWISPDWSRRSTAGASNVGSAHGSTAAANATVRALGIEPKEELASVRTYLVSGIVEHEVTDRHDRGTRGTPPPHQGTHPR